VRHAGNVVSPDMAWKRIREFRWPIARALEVPEPHQD
jgi:hypothetical protein